jgi:hypothetical protein
LRLDHILPGEEGVTFPGDLDFRSKHLPGNQVHDFYRMIFQSIVKITEPTRSRALEALSWILYAKTPMTTSILCGAIGAPDLDAILKLCMGLVIQSDTMGYFQFSHNTTVTEFLHEPKNFEDLGVRLLSPLDLAKRCLEYLDSSAFESLEVTGNYDPRSAQKTHGFGRYIATHWADHVRDVESNLLKGGIDDLSHFRFLVLPKKRSRILQLNDRISSTILMFVAEKGLSEFCRLCLEAKERSS